jgi:hypothetical membrane protein
MKIRAIKWLASGGLVAGALFALALAWFAAPLPNYRHADHPPALLGALGYPGATAWNVVGYGLVGMLALLATQALYLALRDAAAGRTARVGATLALLAALAFTAQGIFPLDISQAIDVGPSRRHVAAWNLWWIAATSGALLTAFGVRRLQGWRTLLPVGAIAAALIVMALLVGVGDLGNGWLQRIALAAWFGWLAWASLLVLRRVPR